MKHGNFNSKSASAILNEVLATVESSNLERVSLADIIRLVKRLGFPILIAIFAIPASLPIPMPPGVTTIFAIPVLLFSLQMLFGIELPYIPNVIAKVSVSQKFFKTIMKAIIPVMDKLEKRCKPRLNIFKYKITIKIYALVCCICAVALAIPLPMIHFIPAFGIVLMSIGVMHDDGLLGIIGLIISFIGFAFVAMAIFMTSKFLSLIF